VAYVLEQGSDEWHVMGVFVRLAAIYRLIPQALSQQGPRIMLSADCISTHVPTRAAFHRLPLTMTIFKMIQGCLIYKGRSLTLVQEEQDGGAAGRGVGDIEFCVVTLVELPRLHSYRSCYKNSDPVVRENDSLYPSFSAFLLHSVMYRWCAEEVVGEKRTLFGTIHPRFLSRYRAIITDPIEKEQHGAFIMVDGQHDGGDVNADPTSVVEFRLVLMTGFRQDDSFASYMTLGQGFVEVYTTEGAARGVTSGSNLDVRLPVTMPKMRSVLGRYGLPAPSALFRTGHT